MDPKKSKKRLSVSESYHDTSEGFYNEKEFMYQLKCMPGGESTRRSISFKIEQKVPANIKGIISIKQFLVFDKLIREKPISFTFYNGPLKDPKDMFNALLNYMITTKVASSSVLSAWAEFRPNQRTETKKNQMTAKQRWIDAAKTFALSKFKHIFRLLLEPSFQDTMDFLKHETPRHFQISNQSCTIQCQTIQRNNSNFTTNLHINPFGLITKIINLFSALSDSINIWLRSFNGGSEIDEKIRVCFKFSREGFSLNSDESCLNAAQTISMCLNSLSEFLRKFGHINLVDDSDNSIEEVIIYISILFFCNKICSL
jgi:hypothetical protein